MARCLALAVAIIVLGVTSAGARGPEDSAESILTEADAALEQRDLSRARRLYRSLIERFPDAPETDLARRSLAALQALEPEEPEPPASTEDQFTLEEPYSHRTGERLRLTPWEKLDFGVTAFLYGATAGAALGIGVLDLENEDSAREYMTLVGGIGLAYTGLSILYLRFAEPDRGDLPVVLGITSYLPATAALLAATADANETNRAVASAGTAFAAVPLALIVAWKTDPDPGDAQLVRDAGFWGLVLALTGTGAVDPNVGGPEIASAGLIGLYGGLGLGWLAAAHSEVTLERTRVTTWGGYAGAIAGALLGWAAAPDEDDARFPEPRDTTDTERAVLTGLTAGAMAGLVTTFALTAHLDRPSMRARPAAGLTGVLEPGVLVLQDARGTHRARPGLHLLRGTF